LKRSAKRKFIKHGESKATQSGERGEAGLGGNVNWGQGTFRQKGECRRKEEGNLFRKCLNDIDGFAKGDGIGKEELPSGEKKGP